MNKKQILNFLLLYKEKQNVAGNFHNFFHQNKEHFENTYAELSEYFVRLLHTGVVDENHKPTVKLDSLIKQTKDELKKEVEIDNLHLTKTRYETRLAKWQVWMFWPLFVIAAIGGGYSIYDFVKQDETVKKYELKNYVKKFELDKEQIK
jgi:hypothetical protein